MTTRIARGQYHQSPCLLLLVLLFGLLPTFAAAQVRDWAVSYDGGGGFAPGAVRQTHTVAADAQGNSWITGVTLNATDTDVLTVKYDVNGSQQWAVTYDGGEADDFAFAVAVDGAGNSYVAGTTYRMTNEYDLQPHALLLKYNPSGTLLWERVYRDGVWTRGMALAVDAAGNSYFAVHNYGDDELTWAERATIPAARTTSSTTWPWTAPAASS